MASHRLETSTLYRERFDGIFAPAEASDGNHRRPAVDFLIAATAEAAGPEVALWCFDRDLKVICEHTGQPEESTGPGH